MHKLAIFVEGYTEILFMEQLISEIAGAHNVIIEHQQIRGGSKVKRRMTTVKASRQATDEKYYVLLMDCGGDALVKTRIQEEHENFTRNGYIKIIGMRDVRPEFTYEDIPKLEAGLKKYVKTALIPVEFVLNVMEIEAWFLAEHNHFPKIDPSITVAAIKATLGFDVEVDDLSQRSTPASDLNSCYMIGGKKYEKSRVATTVSALDFPNVYLKLQNKIPQLRRLTNSIDAFLA